MKEYGGKKYTPEMISSFIIRKVVQDSEEFLGEKIDGVVITVPAYFSDSRRKATEDAAAIAGYPLLGMINEPTAAALCYQKRQKIKNENVMIYDLGGGTFDVTILHIDDDEHIEVLSTDGLSNAGGRFFDQCIIDHVRDYIEEKYDVDYEDCYVEFGEATRSLAMDYRGENELVLPKGIELLKLYWKSFISHPNRYYKGIGRGKPHRRDQKLFWDRGNWQALCKSCHDNKTLKEDGCTTLNVLKYEIVE